MDILAQKVAVVALFSPGNGMDILNVIDVELLRGSWSFEVVRFFVSFLFHRSSRVASDSHVS